MIHDRLERSDVLEVLKAAAFGYRGVSWQAHVRSDAPNVVEVVADIRHEAVGSRRKESRIERRCNFLWGEFVAGIDGEAPAYAIRRRMLFDQWCITTRDAPPSELVLACVPSLGREPLVAKVNEVTRVDKLNSLPPIERYFWHLVSEGALIDPAEIEAWMFLPPRLTHEWECDQ